MFAIFYISALVCREKYHWFLAIRITSGYVSLSPRDKIEVLQGALAFLRRQLSGAIFSENRTDTDSCQAWLCRDKNVTKYWLRFTHQFNCHGILIPAWYDFFETFYAMISKLLWHKC
jgi:hypothetical protein